MESLGINPVLLVTQLINFLIIAVVLTKFLYKPILKAIKERQKKIEEGLELAQKMEEKKLALEADREKVIAVAEKEARGIIESAKKDAQTAHSEILKQGHEEVNGMRSKLEMDLVSQKERLERAMSIHAVELAESMVKKLLSDSLGEKQQRLLIEKQLSQLEKMYEKKA